MPMKKTQHYPQCQYVSADGDESVEGDPIVQQMDEHIQSPRDEENSEQRFVGPITTPLPVKMRMRVRSYQLVAYSRSILGGRRRGD